MGVVKLELLLSQRSHLYRLAKIEALYYEALVSEESVLAEQLTRTNAVMLANDTFYK